MEILIPKLRSNVIHDSDKNRNKQGLVDISLLLIYDNNVRCITNKHNICMKIELSIYKILVLTETWLIKAISSSVYFPNKYEIYRFDRVVSSNVSRRSGGVAMLVHKDVNYMYL